jgi:hypothetical protein
MHGITHLKYKLMLKLSESFVNGIVRNRCDEPRVISVTYTYLNTYWCTEEYSTEIYRQYLRHTAPSTSSEGGRKCLRNIFNGLIARENLITNLKPFTGFMLSSG